MTLEHLGYVRCAGREYVLSPSVLELGFGYLGSLNLTDLAQPLLEDLARTVNQSSSMAVLDGQSIVYVLRVPGRRIMVEDTEAEVRRLLDYCGLPFDENCLRFYENDRPVRTASSEQVRKPIFRDGVDQWRHYEPWLDPLKAALGPVLEAYPASP